jgi:hypothetical protein
VKKSLLVAIVCMAAMPAMAEKYGMAGCGLGSVAFKDKPGFTQVWASLLNSIGFQTFAISTGSSNCREGVSAATLQYIETNKVALKNDISKGQGDTLAGLLNMWGCSDYSAVGSTLQRNYSTISGADQADAMKQSLKNVIQNDQTTSSICQALI